MTASTYRHNPSVCLEYLNSLVLHITEYFIASEINVDGKNNERYSALSLYLNDLHDDALNKNVFNYHTRTEILFSEYRREFHTNKHETDITTTNAEYVTEML